MIFLIANEKFYLIPVLPVVLIFSYVFFKSYEKIIFMVSFLTPLSVSISDIIERPPLDISLFTEPFLILLLAITTMNFLLRGKTDDRLTRHPIFVSIVLILLWTLFTSISSSMPSVSFKYFLSRTWLIMPLTLIGFQLFVNNKKNIELFLWLHIASLFLVILIATVKVFSIYSLDLKSTHFAVRPFYNDHTAYGAVIALLFPVATSFIFIYKKPVYRILSLIVSSILLLGIVLSYSRASWLGIVLIGTILILIILKIKLRYLVMTLLGATLIVSTFWFQIIDRLSKNNQDSSAKFLTHITSISNISTDASNVERLNRWYCALQMFKERPIAGWGPGTYQFQYAPFQLERMRTIISTNFGDIGNAHSEYLGPLAEQGLPGTILFIVSAVIIIYYSFRIYYRSEIKWARYLALGIGLGFITYFFHGLLNNFLNTDKLAIPFYGLTTIIIALNVFYMKESKNDVLPNSIV